MVMFPPVDSTVFRLFNVIRALPVSVMLPPAVKFPVGLMVVPPVIERVVPAVSAPAPS